MHIIVLMINVLFAGAMLFNAALYVPQIVKIVKNRSSANLSCITFIGFLIVQCITLSYGLINQDEVMVYSILPSIILCAGVIFCIFYFKNQQEKDHIDNIINSEYIDLMNEIIAVMPGNVYWMDAEHNFLGCNRNMLKMLGLSSVDEYRGKTYHDFYEPNHIEIIKKNDMKVMRANTPVMLEEIAVPYQIYLTQKVPLHNKEGKVVGLLGISMDITTRKELEENLKREKYKANLANLAKNEIMYNLRHDLNTPLSNIMGISEIIYKHSAEDETKKLIKANATKKLIKFYHSFWNYIASQAKNSESGMLTFGIFGLIAYSLFYFLNKLFFLPVGGYDSSVIRVIIALLCFCLVIKNYWPKRLKKFLPLFWYFVLMFTMPFFITFLLLKNNFSAAWILNELSIVFLMMLLVDWMMYAGLFIIGMGFSMLAFYLTSSAPILFLPGALNISDLVNTFGITIIMGLVFLYKKDQYESFRLDDHTKFMASSIAHELKTPLSTISVRSDIIHQDITRCELIIQKETDIALSLANKFKKILENLRLISIEIDRSNLFINILLKNLTYPQKIKFAICQIKKEVLQAIQRYPFTDKEAGLIKLGQFADFEYMGNADLTIHIIFNLIRNSLYSILTAGYGEIMIETKVTKAGNQLIFFDNGVGIEKEVLPFIFDQFYSKKRHGYGVGLAYCKLIMKSYGGNIYCLSEVGKYAKFVLEFPKISGAN